MSLKCYYNLRMDNSSNSFAFLHGLKPLQQFHPYFQSATLNSHPLDQFAVVNHPSINPFYPYSGVGHHQLLPNLGLSHLFPGFGLTQLSYNSTLSPPFSSFHHHYPLLPIDGSKSSSETEPSHRFFQIKSQISQQISETIKISQTTQREKQ